MRHKDAKHLVMKLKETVILSAALLAFSEAGSADALTNQQVMEPVVAASKGNTADMIKLISNAKSGDAYAQTELGLFYVEKKNYAKAISWFQKAANHGYAPAEDGLALVYYKGLGVPQNYTTKAVYWYGKAAQQGSIAAEYTLGLAYAKGQGVSKDYAKAISWFQKAANHGYAPAEDGLALVYYKGLGVPQNYIKAAYWYKKAAQQGNISAEYTLGLMYANGQGVDKNNKAAIYWWQKAAAQGGEYGNIARHNITIVEHNNSEQG